MRAARRFAILWISITCSSRIVSRPCSTRWCAWRTKKFARLLPIRHSISMRFSRFVDCRRAYVWPRTSSASARATPGRCRCCRRSSSISRSSMPERTRVATCSDHCSWAKQCVGSFPSVSRMLSYAALPLVLIRDFSPLQFAFVIIFFHILSVHILPRLFL
jgi:hypothetical protein